MAEHKQFKYYFDKELAKLLSAKIETVYPEFESKKFINKIDSKTKDLELKARVEVITDALYEFLPSNYKDGVKILLQILGAENKKETGMFKEGYWLMPVALYVEKYGLRDFDISIKAIEEITKRNTGEYAIRPFIIKYTDKTLEEMLKWSKSRNFHLRRLSSEGLRPRLPWAKKLDIFIEDPAPTVEILDNLKSDSSLFVRKSVANHLNDLLKENYNFTIKVIKEWSKNPSKETKWIIKHSLRNEIKKKNEEAVQLLKIINI
ncbi:MAG: DNA alkylation repair protein [Thermodesulfobacteriota bacterium]